MMFYFDRAATPARLLLILASLLTIGGCTSGPQPVAEIAPGYLKGYLGSDQRPDSLKLVPPPPSAQSPAFALDRDTARRSLAVHGTPRWDLATRDADLSFPHAANTFSCALGVPVSKKETPYLYQLLRRTLVDAGLATYKAKYHYKRHRPFQVNQQPTCTPDQQAKLAKNYSYPSGHAAIGWAWALVLSEIAPEHADALESRGLVFGDSRVVCNVHWHSDVVQGRIIGAATVARLNANPTFRSDLEAAKKELEDLRAKGMKPTESCAVQATADEHRF